jgi:CHAT domain-containing protein
VSAFGKLEDISREIHHLDDQWQRFRAGQTFVAQHISQLEQTTERVLGRLYQLLVAPIDAALRRVGGSDVRGLVIVPHGPLHHVPFHALHDGRSHLIDHYTISYAPSATVFALCAERAPAAHDASLVLAVPDEAIPGARHEAEAIAGYLPHPRVVVGAEATQSLLRSAAPTVDIIHLACHGLFRVDNPMFSALKLADGWLTATDVLGCRFGGAQITLSACESGRSQVIGGDELIGLTRAFLGAGATSVVVSQWLVHDAAAVPLMSAYYKALRGGVGRADALRSAQLEARDARPHPYYWAPFSLVGKR